MSYNLFLDDIRSLKDTYNYMKDPRYNTLDWVIVRNFEQFKNTIDNKGIPNLVSYDHDLQDVEEFAPIKGYQGLYEISNYGNVKSIARNTSKGGILKPNKTLGGLTVRLTKSGKNKQFRVHRLVAETFIPNPENKPQVNHIDGNRWNNHFLNLEWNTNSENNKHAHDFIERTYTAYGENHKNSKSISQYKNDILINVYGSSHEASRVLKIPFSNICKVARGERKTAGGFIWKYENKEVTVESNIKYTPMTDLDYKNRFFIPDKYEKTGLDCAKYLISKIEKGSKHPDYLIHSWNPVGKINIYNAIQDFNKINEENK